MKIIVDTFGADAAPDVIIRGALKALEKQTAYDLILVADPATDLAGVVAGMRESAAVGTADLSDRVTILPAVSFVTNEDDPRNMIKAKNDSSMVIALEALRDQDDICAMITAGSTGCALVGSCFHLGLQKGLLQPALASALPTENGKWVILCDCGSNLNPKVKDLADYATLSAAFAKAFYSGDALAASEDVTSADTAALPKVGLINVGKEPGKGTDLIKEAFDKLSSMSGETFEFIGSIEGSDILSGAVDAAVCDGFTGNVLIKALEKAGNIATAFAEQSTLAAAGEDNTLKQNNDAIAEQIRATFDYNNRAGAVFLGTKKLVIKAHGAATEDTITACILQAVRLIEGGFGK